MTTTPATLMVVDDDPDMLMMLQMHLQRAEGVNTVEVCKNVPEAMAMMECKLV